jgi:hypothetical protein
MLPREVAIFMQERYKLIISSDYYIRGEILL